MTARRHGKGGGDGPFVRLSWAMMDSAAFKRLTPAAVWTFAQMNRHYRGGRFVLAFRDVRWGMSFRTFDRARKELIDGGFIVILERHGLDAKATVYGPSERWRERSREILADRTSGRVVRRLRRVNGEARLVSEWEPSKARPAWKDAERRKASWGKVKDRFSAGVAAAAPGPPISENSASRKGRRPGQSLDKHSYRIDPVANDNTPIVVDPVANDKADCRLPRGQRPVDPVANDDLTKAQAPAALKPAEMMPLKRLRALMDRWRSGADAEALAAEFRAAGFEPPAALRGIQ